MNSFNLIENAADSLKHAVAHIGPVEKNGLSDWKRAILDLAHVIELMFKERLKRVHPAFVWANIDKYPSTDAFTVSSEQSFKRLQKLAGISFSKEEIKFVDMLRLKRNEIEHYEFSMSDDEGRMIVGHVLSFILHFASKELDLDWKTEFLDTDKWRTLWSYTEFYEQQLKIVSEQIANDGFSVFNCTSCYNETFVIDKERCLLCGYAEKIFECVWCKEPYLYTDVEYEEAGLCSGCEYLDGLAAAHHEKY